jgi:hypothetical protein
VDFGGKSWGQPTESRKPRLLDQVLIACRQKHFSHRTEKSYVYWIRQFILFNSKRHPGEMGTQQIEDYLNQLAAQMSAMNKSGLMLPEPTSVSFWPLGDHLLANLEITKY